MTVLITGAAGGLGRAFAAECAARGYDLLLTDINGAGIKKIKDGIVRRFGVRVETMVCDLTDEREVDALFCFAAERDAEPDMLLNVAGVDFEGGFTQRSAEMAMKIVRLNIEATLCVTHKALAARKKEGRFYIMFVSSLASFYPMPLKATYAASKRFLCDFAYALKEELRDRDVSVMTLWPAGLATTEDALQGIAAQGIFGELTTNRLEKMTEKAITMALKGKNMYVPGMVNRLFMVLSSVIPRRTIAGLLYNRWKGAQEQWLNT